MDGFITDNQLDNLSDVSQFIIPQIVKWSEETRVEEEGFKEDAGNFLFKRGPIEVDFVDDFCLLLKVYLTAFRRVSALRSAISALAISTFSACP